MPSALPPREYRRPLATHKAFASRIVLAIPIALAFWVSTAVIAAAPRVLHTPSYESPVRADPDDLLMIAGVGFQPTDRVVYAAAESLTPPGEHPSTIPRETNAISGTAPIVLVGMPPYAITVRLPKVLERGKAYRLWVVTTNGQWSAPVSINDPRPQWVTPAYVYATADLANLGRRLRIVGRNLATESGRSVQIRLRGPGTYILECNTPEPPGTDLTPLQLYLAEAPLSNLEEELFSFRQENGNSRRQAFRMKPPPTVSFSRTTSTCAERALDRASSSGTRRPARGDPAPC
jgi:hypothetical protein